MIIQSLSFAILLIICTYANALALYAMTKGYDVPYEWYNRLEQIDPYTGEAIRIVIHNLTTIGCNLPNTLAVSQNNDTMFIACSNLLGSGGFWAINASTGKIIQDYNQKPTFGTILYPRSLQYDTKTNTFAANILTSHGTMIGILNPNIGKTYLQSSWMELNFVLYDATAPYILGNGIYWAPQNKKSLQKTFNIYNNDDDYQSPCKNNTKKFSQLWYHWYGTQPASCSTSLDISGRFATSTTGSFDSKTKQYYVVGNPYHSNFPQQSMALLALNTWTGQIESIINLPLSLNTKQSPEDAWRNLGSLDNQNDIFVFTLSNNNGDTKYLVTIDVKTGKIVSQVSLFNLGPQHNGQKNIWAMSF